MAERPRKYPVGSSRLNKRGEKFTVISWEDSNNILVEFDNGEIVKTSSSCVNSGSILNRLSPTVFGVGITDGWLDRGKSSTLREYRIWTSMLCRVYNEKHKNHCLYAGCSVQEEWLYLKNFAQWITNLPQWKYAGWHLDKDICGGSLYSEDTCFLIPASINCLLTSRGKRARTNPLPRGVRRVGKKYEGRYGGPGREICKSFETVEEAYSFHIKGSKDALLEEVYKFKDQLDPRCFELLINFRMEDLDG